MTLANLDAFARQLTSFSAVQQLGPVFSRAGQEMRKSAQDAAPTGHLPGYQRMIKHKKDGPLAVEVFADTAGQGNLGAVVEFGQGRNAPRPHIIPQLDPEAVRTVDWIEKIIQGHFQ